MSAASLSFLHVAIAPSQRLRVAAPRLNPSPPQALVVEAKTRTRGENRDARHSRIRKKFFRIVEVGYLISSLALEDGGYLDLGSCRTRKEVVPGYCNWPARFAFSFWKVEGTPERPRLCVFRSNKHLYVQVIDDTKMHTLASASTMQKPVSEEFDCSSGPNLEVAKKVGEAIAKSCLEKGITKVAYDRGGYPYHGRVKALADAAREHGLQF
ncbi:hypothetical protein FEM48_Zijuj01G0028600 [Ziziphus jujuba var. spinosa]|uniref:Large ribosomal subunit protein uL18c n=1 Tax=Ziziphus jujuba var. spinosa TaxID=714518 RepID=A0A978VYQ4_ZIZJJ|nr:hypothetical protein FEM48_Zijuj01G0028600 [Ziziphus jujuba var. spinosa]